MDADLNANLDMAFKEDKVILERIQLEEERDPDFKRIILGIDAAPMKMRRMVDKLIEAESATDISSSSHPSPRLRLRPESIVAGVRRILDNLATELPSWPFSTSAVAGDHPLSDQTASITCRTL